VRTSPHSVRLKELSRELGLSITEASKVVKRLVAKGFLRQHSRDPVPLDHPEARFFTEPARREIIDTLLTSN